MDEEALAMYRREETAQYLSLCVTQLVDKIIEIQKGMDRLQEEMDNLRLQLNEKSCMGENGDLVGRVRMHEALLRNIHERMGSQQAAITHLHEEQASTSDWISLITRQIAHLRAPSSQQMLETEPEVQHSSLSQEKFSTDSYDYVLVSEDENEAA